MTTTKKKMPDRCPDHPLSGTVKSTTTESGKNALQQHAIAQYQCAEPGCRQHLGWHYQGPAGAFKAGPGRCNQDILLTVARHKHDECKRRR